MRPVTPSRRYEKNRDASSTVHQPAAADRARRRPRPGGRAPGRQVGQPLARLRPGRTGAASGRAGIGAEGLEHVGADLEARAARCRPRARRRARAGAQSAASHSAATVASSTPAARPRQPAWAAATPRAVGRGEQHRQAVGDLHRAGDAGLGGDAGIGLVHRRVRQRHRRRRCRTTRVAVHLAQEDRRARRSAAAKRARLAATAAGVVADRDAEVHRWRTAPSLTPPVARRHQRADARRSPSRGASQSAGTAHAASGQAEGCGRAERRLGHAGLEDAHHRRHVVEPAVHALGVEDLRHEHAVGQRRRVAVAEAPGRRHCRRAGARPSPGRSRPSAGTSGSCRPRETFISCTR